MKSAGIFLLSLTMAVVLTGCDTSGNAAEPADRIDEAPQFGEVSRQADPTDPEGRSFILRVRSNAEANWFDATRVIARADQYCEGGADYTEQVRNPAFDPMKESPEAATIHPAGTTFEQRIRCKVEYPHEIRLATNVTPDQAMTRMARELSGTDRLDPLQFMAMAVTFNDSYPKYAAVNKALGRILTRGQQMCRWKGVAFPQTLLMSMPTPMSSPGPEDRMFANGSRAYVGVEFSCLDGLPPEASP